ncbi:MAG: hypothetical protein K8W52_13960 [Deltaproteobacteria bacterium]|nr:hypothetical protein [Deltaproteobacteria bacterium]
MRVIVSSVVALAATGCFYVDPINERPSAEIVRDNVDLPHRGEVAQVHARYDDPDGDPVRIGWSALACGAGGLDCDAVPFQTGTTSLFTVVVPYIRADGTTVGAVRMLLDVADRWNAQARPEQQLVIDVVDHAPTVEVQTSGRQIDNHYPVTVPIRVAAMFSDLDSGDDVTLTWKLFPAAGSRPETTTWEAWPGPPTTGLEEMKLIPDVGGNWTVRVTAVDGQGEMTVTDRVIDVREDAPPCIGALDPGTADATIIVDAPRRFAVLSVDDDINVYPAPSSNDEFLRAATFAWALASPATGGALEPVVGLGTSDLVIDPANYQPGDTLDVRVEIGDAIVRPLPCDPASPTCSVNGSTCMQRQTWHLEIR